MHSDDFKKAVEQAAATAGEAQEPMSFSDIGAWELLRGLTQLLVRKGVVTPEEMVWLGGSVVTRADTTYSDMPLVAEKVREAGQLFQACHR